MMRTEDLIQSLAAETRPVSRHAMEHRLLAGLAVGGAGTLLVIAATIGFRPDLPTAMTQGSFLMKWAYSLSLALIAGIGALRLARPNAARWRTAWLVAVPVALLALASMTELAMAPRREWMAMAMGHSWWRCALGVALLSAPIFAGIVWAFRRFAPVNLRAAGAAAGLVAGAASATLYALHCNESTATFVATWYTLGIAAAALLGALAGPRLLRW